MRREGERRISVIDLFLLLLLVLCLVGGLLRRQDARARREESLERYRAVWISETLLSESADCLAVGEELFDLSGTSFGRVTAIERVTAPLVIETANGTVRGEWEIGERCRLRVEVEMAGSERGGVLLLGGTLPLGVGGARALFSERMRLDVRLLEFSSQMPQAVDLLRFVR